MEILANNIEAHNFSEQSISLEANGDYSGILKTYSLSFSESGFYWQVGEIERVQGWILHLSVIKVQILDLFATIIPELLLQNVPFKIVMSESTASFILEGNLGYTQLGKVVCIYPSDDNQAIMLAKTLIEKTKYFKGPVIPTDAHLGSIVYTRYGSFNPVLKYSENGEKTRYIYNQKGDLIPDNYSIPFVLSPGVNWPFNEVNELKLSNRKKIINNTYYPISVIKPDAKGDVLKAIYFKSITNIKFCLLKQGRQNMFADELGRDIQERLKWQFDLYNDLSGEIPLPAVFEYFKENDASYLVMEFIKGKSIRTWLHSINNNTSWLNLTIDTKLIVLKCLLNLISIIKRLHSRGYIHRDITPENFLIDKRGRIFLIDMELAWSKEKGGSPFTLGTPGYMSMEQMKVQTPTVKEDIYGLGALMVLLFSGLPITQLDIGSLNGSLIFFTGEQILASLTADCLKINPVERPSLGTIESTLWRYTEKIQMNSKENELVKKSVPAKNDITRTVQAAICGLGNDRIMTHENIWISSFQRNENSIGNDQRLVTHYVGLHTGISGVLYLLARAKRVGFEIEMCQTCYNLSWEYIRQHFFKKPNERIFGLHSGGAGIALALIEGIKSSLLTQSQETFDYLDQCFDSSPTQLDISAGIAGQGMALLQCMPWMDSIKVKERLESYIISIIKSQQSDGSWQLNSTSRKNGAIITGLDFGVAGVVWFLLVYLQFYQDSRAEKSVVKGINWLLKNSNKKNKKYSWQMTTKSKSVDTWSCSKGIPGVMLAFIKAYEVLKKPLYREIAEVGLNSINPCPVRSDFTLGSGLAGLGEVYLEAYRVFANSEEWRQRSNWISQLFVHSFIKTKDNEGLWQPNSTNSVTADLFTGNSGIIHFLIHNLFPEKLSHPLLPETINIT